MRHYINTNHIPPSCEHAGLAPLNMHYHPERWPATRDDSYTVDAFSSGVNPYKFDGPFCLDIEPAELWGEQDRAFKQWLRISTHAIESARGVFSNPLFAYDAVGGRTLKQAAENVTAASDMLLSLDGAGLAVYAKPGATTFTVEKTAAATMPQYIQLRASTKKRWQVGAFVWSDGLVGDRVFVDSVRWCMGQPLDWICLWQAAGYHWQWRMDMAAKRLQRVIDLYRKAVQA